MGLVLLRVALAGSSVHDEQKKVQASTSTAADETKNGSHEPVFRTMSSASSGEMTPGRFAMVLPRPVRIPVSCASAGQPQSGVCARICGGWVGCQSVIPRDTVD